MEKTGEIVAGIALILLVINWLMALLVGFLILYCWGGYIAAPIYETWALLLLYIVCAFIGFYLMKRNLSGFLGSIGESIS